MRKTLITAFIVIIFTACLVNYVKLKNTLFPLQQVKDDWVTVSPSSEKFFINSNEGWRAAYEAHGMFNMDMVLYKTKDGGKTWTLVGNSKDNGSTLPGGNKIGMSFISSTKGWITADTPWEGKVDLYVTSDGGKTWREQKPQVPNEFQHSDIYTIPPLFFSASEGVLLAQTCEGGEQGFLFYISQDGGENWTNMPKENNGVYGDIKWSFKKGTTVNTYEVISHNSAWILDNDTWIKKGK